MSADNFHHQVERCMRQKKTVEDFQDLVDVVSTCGQSLVIKCNDFSDFPKGISQDNYTREKPKLEQAQVIKFERRSIKIFLEGKSQIGKLQFIQVFAKEVQKKHKTI